MNGGPLRPIWRYRILFRPGTIRALPFTRPSPLCPPRTLSIHSDPAPLASSAKCVTRDIHEASTKLQKLASHRKGLQSRDHRERSWPRLALELLQFGVRSTDHHDWREILFALPKRMRCPVEGCLATRYVVCLIP